MLGACVSASDSRRTPLFGERKESSPQLRLPPRSGLLEVTVLIEFRDWLASFPSLFLPSESRLAQPLFSFSSLRLVVSLSLLYFVTFVRDGAHPLAEDALAEMPEGSFSHVLALPPTAHIFPRRKGGEGCGGAPNKKILTGLQADDDKDYTNKETEFRGERFDFLSLARSEIINHTIS